MGEHGVGRWGEGSYGCWGEPVGGLGGVIEKEKEWGARREGGEDCFSKQGVTRQCYEEERAVLITKRAWDM